MDRDIYILMTSKYSLVSFIQPKWSFLCSFLVCAFSPQLLVGQYKGEICSRDSCFQIFQPSNKVKRGNENVVLREGFKMWHWRNFFKKGWAWVISINRRGVWIIVLLNIWQILIAQFKVWLILDHFQVMEWTSLFLWRPPP